MHLLHLVGILFPHINDDARSKSHQINLIRFRILYSFLDKSLRPDDVLIE